MPDQGEGPKAIEGLDVLRAVLEASRLCVNQPLMTPLCAWTCVGC